MPKDKDEGEMLTEKLINTQLICFVLLVAIRNVLLMFSAQLLSGILFYAIYVVLLSIVVVAVFSYFKKKHIVFNAYKIVSVLLITLLLLIPFSYGLVGWSLNGFAPVSFFLTISFFVFCRTIIVSDRVMKACFYLSAIEAMVALVLSFLPDSYEDGSLVLHLGNPNQTSLFLWGLFSYCLVYWITYGKKKFILFPLILMISVLVFLTKSRTGMLSCSLSFVLTLWACLKKRTTKPMKTTLNIISALPLVTPIVILFLLSTLSYDFTILGKPLFSGRELIWKNILDESLLNPFQPHLDTAPYYSGILIDGVSSIKAWGAHNGFMSILWNYGFVVALLSLALSIFFISDLNKFSKSSLEATVIFVVFASTIASLSFEEGAIMGNVCTTTLLPMLYLFAKKASNEEYAFGRAFRVDGGAYLIARQSNERF